MQFGVNLLPQEKKSTVDVELQKKVRLILGVVLSLYILFVLALFSVTFYLAQDQKKVTNEIKKAETQIQSYKKRESLAITLKQRMEQINKIIKTRSDLEDKEITKVQLLTWLEGLVTPGISLSQVRFSTDSISFNGEAEDVTSVAEFIEQFSTHDKKFSRIVLDSLSKSAKGTYSFSLRCFFL